MEMILLDWTRMGVNYCIAGAVRDGQSYRIVRPLPATHHGAGIRNFGWAPRYLNGCSRWEGIELIGWTQAEAEPPHLEDGWVTKLRPNGRSATLEERRAILAATMPKPNEPLFGIPLQTTRAAAYLPPGHGSRSLSTIVMSPQDIRVKASWRGVYPDYRVALAIPDLGPRSLPIKDHVLLERTQPLAVNDLTAHVTALTQAIADMGPTVAIRLGLARAFAGDSKSALCWLMADGFFSFTKPSA